MTSTKRSNQVPGFGRVSMKILKNPYVQTFIGVVLSIVALRLIVAFVPLPEGIKKWVSV